MKKQAGFSLIELVVAMAVLALIMGAMVHLFGGSVTSLHAGAKQEVVYEEARLLMNELKTTLRYADKDSIKLEKLDDKTTTFSYSGTMWDRHMDIKDGQNISYDIIVQWKDAGNGLKQLEVKREDRDASGNNISSKTISFPKDTANSLFEAGSPFPITAETVYKEVVMYKIALPVQYLLNGKRQTQTLETKVVPSRDEITETPEEKMRREYMEILEIGLIEQNNGPLSSKQEKLRDDFYAKMSKNSSHLRSNDRIREYMCKEIYGGHWPSIDLTTSTGTKISSVCFQPACFDMTNVDNVFVMGREFNVKYDYSTWDGGWNVRSVYDHKRKLWRTGAGTTVMSKNWDELEALMEKQNYQDVKKVEYK
ncbi:hypothetical protein CE91St52_01130 [Phascolarctobacterium faecium]|uniref:prepilin-type N-terminal cleavage/methylation domain-containing protein n=1 Tax=Phascolarctobacterium faecium TaxID=33025 RepID=UPI001FCA8925|nr:prepilin-type N-terminal cleavage/methylation domain-containing protein [Phascolarctobacterium faecium]BDE83336.1 hypothetical protein CE91St52_01130 [Phascolarctobacterium faecium]BDE92460.1 hypothetical protein CE91St53_01120 [Phascolarctobacterium faecium]